MGCVAEQQDHRSHFISFQSKIWCCTFPLNCIDLVKKKKKEENTLAFRIALKKQFFYPVLCRTSLFALWVHPADYQQWWMIWTLLQTRDNVVSRTGTLFNQGHSGGSSLAGGSFMATSRVLRQSPSQHIFHYQQQKGCWGLSEWQRAIRATAKQQLWHQIAASPGFSEE